MKIPQETIRYFVKSCHEIGNRKLLRCSSGNVSFRVKKDYMLITSSRSWKGEICPSQLTLCRIHDNKIIWGNKPSVESMFHAGILKNRPEINTVLHFQSPNATVLACTQKKNINYFVIPEIPFYIGKIATIPFFIPGSKELAEAVIKASMQHNLIILRNHGQVTMAEDFQHVIQNADFFELACEIIVKNNFNPSVIPQKEVEYLLELGKQSKSKSV